MEQYILFGDKNTYIDYKLLIQSLNISTPQPKEELVDVPGSDGILDFSESLTGDTKYQNRIISIVLNKAKNENCLVEYSKIQNDLHGKRMKIILSEDQNFYYYGKIKVKDYDKYSLVHYIEIECDVEPYKYDLTASDENWLWDPFSFIDGIINETKDLVVNGELEVILYGRRKRVVPWITCDHQMQVIFKSNTYNLLSQRQKVLNIEICEGENKLKFVGYGKVTIEYRGGSL